MSLRKKACSSCVAAKRKCDSALPACQRCVQRSLVCQYPYPLPQCLQNSQRDETGQEDIARSSLVALTDLENHSTDGTSVTDSFYSRESVFGDYTDSINSPDLINSEESTAEEHYPQSAIRNLPWPGYDHSYNNTQWPVSFDRRILEFYPRVDDKETWAFGVKTLLNQVNIFLRTGSAFFTQPPGMEKNLLPSLRVAYGVCSAYRVRTESELPFFQQLLENEIENLVALRPTDILQDLVAELCAILLYYIIIHFDRTSQQRNLVDKSETLLAQHTARVEGLELATRQTAEMLVESGLLSPEEEWESWYLCESARKIVMVSYLAREIHHVLRFRTCYLLRQIVSLPVSKEPVCVLESMSPAGGQNIVSYDEFVRHWEAGELGVTNEFTYFLISTCKGIKALECTFE